MADLACFESVAVFAPGNGVCERCEHVRECHAGALARLDLLPDAPEVAAARQRLIVLGQSLGSPGPVAVPVTVSRRGIARRPLSEGESMGLAALPARARQLAQSLAKRGWFDDARRQLARGMNPGRPGSAMGVVCALMLAGGSARSEALQALCNTLEIKPGSAQVELSTVLAVLQHARIASVTAGRIALHPTLTVEHSPNATPRAGQKNA